MMQRLITQQAVDQKGARYITDTLWLLMESGTEEVKVLQTVTLLLTSNAVVHGDTLARNLVLCFRLHFTKDCTTINTAGATVRQLVSLVFERVVAEDGLNPDQPESDEVNLEELKIPTNQAPKGLGPCAADAYLMFQDLVQLVNADQPYWLIGITEMTRTFGLELLESVLTNFSSVFFKHPEFSFLLKERVCALVIKLFSPNIKYRNSVPASLQQATPLDKPYFPISMRLLRVVSILIQKYHSLLVTECEIFLSLIVKFLDPDKPTWQRALALEVLHKMTVQADLLTNFCECYDLKPHATNIFQDIVNSLGAYVLFPLLDKVRSLSNSASSEKVDTSGNILIHHSRNTAQKQWAETQVLTLSGVARVFNTKRQLLQMLGDFPRAWSLLLEFIENSALSKNNEVSLAALKSFQEILFQPKGSDSTEVIQSNDSEGLWTVTWRVWLNIGMESTAPPQEGDTEPYVPSQAFLTALMHIFPGVFQHIRSKFTGPDLQKLCIVLKNAVAVPVHGESTPYILPSVPDVVLTHLQDEVLHSMELLQKEALNGPENLRMMIVLIFLQLLSFSKLACEVPTYGKVPTKHISQVRGASADWVTMNYVPFGEKALSMVVSLYQKTAHEMAVIDGQVLKHIVEALHVPLAMKYACPSATTWKLAVTSLLAVLHTGLPLARKYPEQFQSMWLELASTLDDFLFPKSVLNVERGVEEIQADEAVDCQVMELLRDEVLPHSQHIPHQFILRVVMLLNKGSIHSATTANIENGAETKLREEFAKTCFETLLQFSLLDGLNNDTENSFKNSSESDEGGIAGRLAVTALLHRFQEVLRRYIESERRSGKCPLPRYRLSEISFVLKAVATLVVSLKKAPPNKVERSVWEQLIGLYPCLVECTIATTSGQVSRSLREALLQYHDLLRAPVHSTPTPNGV